MNENEKPIKAAGGNEISLWNIVRLLLGKIHWLVLSGIAFGLGIYLILALFVTPTYESHVSFYVYNSADSASHSGTINNNDLQAAESLATTYSKILESNSVLDAVLNDLGNGSGLTRKELSEMINVAVISDTQLLEVVITSTDAEFACKVAESFAMVAPTEIVRITKAGGVEVVDRPEVAMEKSSPRTIFDTAVGLVVGVIIVSIILILRMLSDTTIYLPEDIDSLVGVTVLGQIPEINVSGNQYKHWTLMEGGTVRYDNKEGSKQDE